MIKLHLKVDLSVGVVKQRKVCDTAVLFLSLDQLCFKETIQIFFWQTNHIHFLREEDLYYSLIIDSFYSWETLWIPAGGAIIIIFESDVNIKGDSTKGVHLRIIDYDVYQVYSILRKGRVHFDAIEYPLREAFYLRCINPKYTILQIYLVHQALAEINLDFFSSFYVKIILAALVIIWIC